MAEQAKKAAPKRKTTAKQDHRQAQARGPQDDSRKARRKPKKAPSLQSRVSEAGRNAFLASLGFYGMAFDQMQDS
jgi:hypothetical protein